MQILHLSDIHFGKLLPKQVRAGGSVSAHRFVRRERDEPNPGILADILKRSFDSQHPRVMILSGDVGWSGAEEDYEYALEFFDVLKKEWESTEFIIAPGNHDVILSREKNRHEYYVKFLQKYYGHDFEKYYPLLKEISVDDNLDPSLIVAFHQITISDNIFKGEVLIVAVNSAAYIQDKGTPVYVHPDVLQRIKRQIREMNLSSETLRLFVIHHHLLPFAEPDWGNVIDLSGGVSDKPDPTIVANSAKLQAWLAEESFHIVMHGHKHQSHGREDVLIRRTDPPGGRRLFIIGAGSAGVEQFHRSHQEPLSYNLLSVTKLSQKRWHIDVSVKQIQEDEIIPRVEKLYNYSADIGSQPGEYPHIFHTEYMDDCHQIIKEYSEGKGVLRNFISIVENFEYRHPKTTRIGEKEIIQEEVESSFNTLHPEYKPSKKWTDFSQLDASLQSLSRRFQFQHGPRLFGIPNEGRYLKGNNVDRFRPIIRAVENLKLAAKSHSYVSLFRPDIDVLNEGEPLPGMMSIQFVSDYSDKYLDVVVTFRKVELSFWWVVNMYEIGELLLWATSYEHTKRRKPRRITFFSALAEWKDNPEPVFITRLDQMTIEEMTSLLLNIDINKDKYFVSELVSILDEKYQHTNENSLDSRGLEVLCQLLRAFIKRHRKPKNSLLSQRLSTKLFEAENYIRKAMGPKLEERYISTQNARTALKEAIDLLKSSK